MAGGGNRGLGQRPGGEVRGPMATPGGRSGGPTGRCRGTAPGPNPGGQGRGTRWPTCATGKRGLGTSRPGGEIEVGGLGLGGDGCWGLMGGWPIPLGIELGLTGGLEPTKAGFIELEQIIEILI